MLREASAALRERDFRLLFLARTASLLGSSFAPVALAFAVLDDLDGSPTELGLVLAAAWVPQILLTLVGGVWADRLPRNLVMVGTDLTMFAVQATVATLLLTGTAELWHVLVLQVVRGSAEAFFWPAAAGLTPHVVSESRLPGGERTSPPVEQHDADRRRRRRGRGRRRRRLRVGTRLRRHDVPRQRRLPRPAAAPARAPCAGAEPRPRAPRGLGGVPLPHLAVGDRPRGVARQPRLRRCAHRAGAGDRRPRPRRRGGLGRDRLGPGGRLLPRRPALAADPAGAAARGRRPGHAPVWTACSCCSP